MMVDAGGARAAAVLRLAVAGHRHQQGVVQVDLVVQALGHLVTVETEPPCMSTRLRTRVRPMPSPPSVRASEPSDWTNGSKTRPSTSGGTPIPLSRTRTTASLPSVPALTQMCPPGIVYLAALLRRLAI